MSDFEKAEGVVKWELLWGRWKRDEERRNWLLENADDPEQPQLRAKFETSGVRLFDQLCELAAWCDVDNNDIWDLLCRVTDQ